MFLQKASLPYSEITVRSDDVPDYAKPYLHILVDVFNSCSVQPASVHPYLTGEDKHTYGVVMDANDNQIRILFFTPDLPLMIEKLEQKDSNALIQWIQTVSLEYVPSLYSYLKSRGLVFPFPCPSLPSREDVSFSKRVTTRIVENCSVCL